jgi:general stress protein YciG
MTKSEAGRIGGQALYAKKGPDYFREIGRKGAETTWNKYSLVPMGTNQFAMVERETGRVVAIHS